MNSLVLLAYCRVVLLTQFGANFISQLIASVGDIKKARTASKHILNVINEKAVEMNNLSDEGLRPVSFNAETIRLIRIFTKILHI